MKLLFLYLLLLFFLKGGGQHTVKIKPNNLLAKIAAKINKSENYALTWGNTIRISCSRDKFFMDTIWVKHEINHVFQWKRYGKLRFAVKYVYYFITRGYRRNPLEIEANSPKILLE